MVRHNLRQRPHPLVCVPTTQEYRQQANKYVTSADVVLEVGSAHGVTTMLLATLAKTVVGVDCDPKMLSRAREKYARQPQVLLLRRAAVPDGLARKDHAPGRKRSRSCSSTAEA